MQARRALIVANWKMNKTIAESQAYVRELLACASELEGLEAVICPSFTSMRYVSDILAGTRLRRRRAGDVGSRFRFVHRRNQRRCN